METVKSTSVQSHASAALTSDFDAAFAFQVDADDDTSLPDVTCRNHANEKLPTPFELWKYIYASILFGNPLLRDLVWINLAVHVTFWLLFSTLLWAVFLGYLPFSITFKAYFFGSMAVVAVCTDFWGILLNATMLIRLRDNVKYPSFGKACRNLIQNKRFSSIASLTGATTGVRILYLTSNNLIPFFGTFILPLLVQKCTVRQVGVAWEQQMDMSLAVGINERLGYPTSRYRAIAYLKHRWGGDPYPLVNATSVIILPLLAFIFFVILPLMVVGLVRKNREILAAGFSCVIFLFGFIQFARPLPANIYSMAAYRYTEYGENDLFSRWPTLAPRAYRSRAREREERDAKKADANAAQAKQTAVGGDSSEDDDGWVLFQGGAQEEVDSGRQENRQNICDGER